jgi:hypothetical protein
MESDPLQICKRVLASRVHGVRFDVVEGGVIGRIVPQDPALPDPGAHKREEMIHTHILQELFNLSCNHSVAD